MNINRIAALAVIAVLTTFAATAALAAPSFDCAKAASAAEKAICSDATLSDMDRKLDESYRAVLSRLSAPAQAQVRDGQRQWLRYAATVCGRVSPPKKDTRARAPTKCLLEEYKERQTQLESAVEVKSGKTFYYVQGFRAKPSPVPNDIDGTKPGFTTTDVSYPQLDRPATSSETALNAKLAEDAKKTMRALSDSEDTGLEIKLSAALPALLSFDGISSYYGHGTPHGQYNSYSFHWLVREGRALQALDIFSAQTKWQDFLRDRCFDGVKHFGKVEAAKDLRDDPLTPDRWSFDKQGLTVTFNPYAVAGYAQGEPQVTIAWDKLKPYLAKTAPAILAGAN